MRGGTTGVSKEKSTAVLASCLWKWRNCEEVLTERRHVAYVACFRFGAWLVIYGVDALGRSFVFALAV